MILSDLIRQVWSICDPYYGRLSPGKNLGALVDEDALVAISAFK